MGLVLTTSLLLALAIVAEVSGTLALRWSEGFGRLVPSALVVACYVVAFVALSFVLKRGMSVAVAYAVWSAVGILAISVIGVLFLDERLNVVQVVGLVVVVCGVVTLELGTGSA